MEKLYSRKETAAILGIGLTTLDAARAAGQITYVQYISNGKIRFTENAIQEYIGRCTHRAHPVGSSPSYHEHKATSR